MIERTHVFTHVEWHMRCCCYVRVAEPGGDFTWVDGAELFAQHRPADGLPDVLEPEDGRGGEITVAFL
ncbi:MAG: hypothetical protein ACLU3I_04440 [Acutalibacteraceae bacterium]